MSKAKASATPPTRSLFRLAAVLALCACLPALSRDWNGVADLLGLSVLLCGVGLWINSTMRAAASTNVALDLITRGDFIGAEAQLATISHPRRAVRRAIGIQRTLVAVLRGEPDRAVTFADEALAMRVSPLDKQDAINWVSARALRALAHAMFGNETAALADAAAVSQSSIANPEAIARAHLAVCVLRARAGDRAALAKELAATAGLTEWMVPRERALFRALRRKLRSAAPSIYREPAVRAADGDGSALEGWIDGIVDGAGRHAGRAEHAATTVLPEMPVAHEQKNEPTTALLATKRGWRRVTGNVLMTVLGVVALGIASTYFGWRMPEMAQGGAASFVWPFALGGVVGLGILLLVNRGNASVLDAMRLIARDDFDAARPILERAARRSLLVGVSAQLALAQQYERLGNFEMALTHADRGIAGCSGAMRDDASVVLLPALVGERAFALAALGRLDESRAALGVLVGSFPSYALLTRARYRIELLLALHTDQNAARALAGQRTADLPITVRDELLADALLATESAATSEQIEVVLYEIEADARSAAWLEKVAPRLVADLRVRNGTRVAQAHLRDGSADVLDAAALEEASAAAPLFVAAS